MRKRTISLLVAITMLFSCLPIIAGAETNGTCGDSITWILGDDGTLTISGSGDMPDYDWSSTAPWDSQKDAITKIVVSDGVTSIGDLAFNGCKALADVTIADTVTSIGCWAFCDCNNLNEVDLPTGLKIIKKAAFMDCGIQGEFVIPDSVDTIQQAAFVRCEELERIILPDGLTLLEGEVFFGCSSLSYVKIPDSLTKIGSEFGNTFGACVSLTELPILPSNLTDIGDSTFSECTGLTNIVIPDHVTRIGDSAFDGCSGITTVTLTDGLKEIASRAFSNCTSLKSITIPNSVTSIGDSIFSSCNSLTEVTLPDNMTAIPNSMFYYCNSLEEVELPSTVTSIGDYAFSNCTLLKNITLPKSITTIPNNAFYACTSLESISIPENVTSIGTNAFYGCSSLSDIRIPVSVTAINSNAFYNCSALSSVYYGGEADNWTAMTISSGNTPLTNADIRYNYGKIAGGTIGDNITWLIDDKGTLTISGNGDMPDYAYDETTPWFEYRDKITTLNIESGITKIGGYSFSECTSLINVQIPNTVNEIGEWAFKNCSAITTLTIPDSVTKVGWFAFAFCEGLEQIKLSRNLTVIDRGTFTNCTSLSSIVIPDGVTTINKRAFECTSLKCVTLSANLTTFEDYLFEACDLLNGVFYRGSKEQWDALVAGATQPIPDNVAIYYNHIWGNVIDCGTLNSTVNWLVDDLGNLVIGGSGAITSEPWSSYKSSVTNIVIGDEITAIDTYRFQLYSNVKTITIGKNLKDFGDTSVSFAEMYNLETIYWNAAATDDLLFGGEYSTSFLNNSGKNCGGTNIIFGEDVEVIPNCFQKATINKMVIPSNAKTIGIKNISAKEIHISDLASFCNIDFSADTNPLFYNAKLYMNGEAVTELVIPDGVTNISDYAFYNLKDIISVTIPDSVTEIGNYAFYNCNGITNLNIGNSVTSIGDYAFYGCSGIAELNLGESVTSVGNNAFASCTGLTSIRFSENMSSIGTNAFLRCNSIDKIYYGGGIYDYENIEGISYVPNATIYYNYTNLIKGYGECGDNVKWVLTDSGKLTISGTGAIVDFDGRYNAWLDTSELIIEEGVTSIPDKLFRDHSTLEKVAIADTVETIGYQAFSFCSKLSDLTIGKGVSELGDSAFSYCESLKSVTIPGSVQTITHNAFEYCDNLETLVIEEGVQKIDYYAFIDCPSLKELTLPVSVKSIGIGAFGYCTSLSKVNYTGTKDNWNGITIESGNESLIAAYENSVEYEGNGKCGANLEWVLENGVLRISGTGDMYDFDISDAALPWYELGDSVTSIVIEDGVTGIGAYTFWLCFNLKEVTIPASVTEIRTYAFGNCDKLTDVYYIGSKANWETIVFDDLNPYIKDAKIHNLEHELNLEFDENKIFINSDKKVDSATILVALYDSNGAMLCVKYVNADIIDGITVITSPIDDYSGASVIKVLGWNGVSGLIPIFKATEIKN